MGATGGRRARGWRLAGLAVALVVASRLLRSASAQQQELPIPKVVFAGAGTVDDCQCIALLAKMHEEGEIDFLGDVLLNFDSLLPSSMQVTEVIHELAGIPQIPSFLSQTKAYNAFPYLYRGDSVHMAEMPAFQGIPCDSCTNVTNAADYPDAESWLAETLAGVEGDGGITYVCTAPLSNLAAVLRSRPELAAFVKEILWMGGAVDVPGNLEVDQFKYTTWNDKAEWNAYAAPYDTAFIFETAIPISMFPLDISNQVPVAGTFMETLQAALTNASQEANATSDALLIELMYAFYEEIALPAPMYRLWNTVVVGYLSPALQPYYAPPEVMNITIVTDFEDQGWTKKQDLGGGDGAIYRSVPVFMSFTSEEDKDKWMEAIANFDV